jgi:hypothetical protein
VARLTPGLLPGLKGEIRSQLTLERCNDQQLALGDHSAVIHPGAETEILSLGNNLTEFEASSPFGRKQTRDVPSHVAEARVSEEESFFPRRESRFLP